MSSIFRIVCDGVDIYDPSSKDLVLISPVLNLEVGTAGSLEFVMPPGHTYYDYLVPMGGNMEVYEDNELIWFGRPRTPKTDFFKQKHFHCEGALAYLNDSVVSKEIIWESSTLEILQKIITQHNQMVVNPNRCFSIGNVGVFYKYGQYREFNHETALEAIKRFVIATDGGYLFVRKQAGESYLDWYDYMPSTCNQPLQFQLNLADLTLTDDYAEICTGVLAVGKDAEGEEIELSNIVWAGEAIQAKYGNIVRKVVFDDATNDSELTRKAVEYLGSKQFANVVIECKGVDLHYLNTAYDKFKLGQTIHCVSQPHLIEVDLPLTKMTIHLDTGAKDITVGTEKKPTLTSIVRRRDDETEREGSGDGQDESAAINDLNDRVSDLEDIIEEGGVDNWIHQIDGVTQATGTVNFVTEVRND